jgi:energy-coupling factor transporter ATP-binding protein EcfA2
MHLRSIQITNLRSLREVHWELPREAAGSGWHVVVGDNGSGKSTFLRAVAVALVGPKDAFALRQSWEEWLRHGESDGSVRVDFDYQPDYDKLAEGLGSEDRRGRHTMRFYRSDGAVRPDHVYDAMDFLRAMSCDKRGWFSASYGPFRRFGGGDKDLEKLFTSHPKLARHLSVFGESVALSEALEWLKFLQFRKLEGEPEGALIEPLTAFVNQSDFLPNDARLHSISSKGVRFVDGNGCEVAVEDLSDGYRSVLSMTFELIRQLAHTYGQGRLFDPADPTRVVVPGVVLVDEIDAHLHPAWQRRIGRWFCAHFPNLQFIVTTHSPLVCQAAVTGSVFRLARPGSGEPSEMLTGIPLKRLLYGNILDAYASGAFGETVQRSEDAQRLLLKLAELNQKELDEGLSEDEIREQYEIRAIFPTEASVRPGDPRVKRR